MLFLGNIGFSLWLINGHVLLALVSLPMRCGERCRRYRNKLQKHLFWNAFLQIYISIYFELALFSTLNILNADWDSENDSEKASNAVALVVFTAVLGLPIALLVLLGCNIPLWDTESFKAKYGTIMEGTNLNIREEYRKHLLIVKFFHFFRRAVFVANLVFLKDHL